MKYTVNFYLDKRTTAKDVSVPVYLFVSFGGKRIKYYTGERCAIKHWADKSKDGDKIQRVKRNVITSEGETSSKINRRLDKLESEVEKWFVKCGDKDVVPDVNGLKKHLDNFLNKTNTQSSDGESFFDRYKQYRKNSNFSEGRKRHLKISEEKLKSYFPKTTFDIITPEFLTGYRNHLVKSGLGKNSVASELKYLRAFLHHSFKIGWTNNYPFKNFSIEAESYSDPVYITIKERDELFHAKIEKKYLRRVRDIFVFQCMIGCRVGDLLKLRKSNIVDGCIEYIAGKTKDDNARVARIPLTEKAKEILSRYDLPNELILPFISAVKYNKYIKELFLAAKITRMVTVRDPKTGLAVQRPINEIASSHMARRVFIGGLYGKGVKNEIIASMSGHASDSKSFSRYYTIEKQNQIDAIKEIE